MATPTTKTPLSSQTRRAALASIDGLVVLLKEWNHQRVRPVHLIRASDAYRAQLEALCRV